MPGAPAVTVNSWSVSSAVDFLNCFSTLTTVCGSSSLFTQVIFSPDFTVRVCGSKWKSLISIRFATHLSQFGRFRLSADRAEREVKHGQTAEQGYSFIVWLDLIHGCSVC